MKNSSFKDEIFNEIAQLAWNEARGELTNPHSVKSINAFTQAIEELYGSKIAHEYRKSLLEQSPTPPTEEKPEKENPLEKDLDAIKLGMMTDAEKEAYLKKKREKSDSLEEDVWVKNIASGNVYIVKKANPSKHTPPSKDEIEKTEKEKSNGSGDSKSKQTQKIADNLKGRKDSDGNTLDAETTNNGSLILGVEHGEGTESTQQSIKQIQSLPKDTKVMFVGEGGMTRDDNGNLELAGEQAEFRNATREHFSNWEESSWDENANVYDGDSPVYDSVAQSLGGSKSKAFAAVWSNMVGQGDDMNADDYLDDEGKEWLINQAKKGGSKEFDGDVDWNNLTDEQRGDLYELNFRDDNRLGETEISKSQEAYNNFRQKELDRKIKEAEDAGYTVIAPVGNSHVDLWRQRNKPKTESILRKTGISDWEFEQLLKEFSLIYEASFMKREKSDSLEEDVWVKNKKSGSVYQVKKFNKTTQDLANKNDIAKVEKEKSNGGEEDKTIVPEKKEKENPNKKNGHEGEEIREISDDELNPILEKYVNNEGPTPDNMRPIADKYADQDMDEGYSDDDFYSEKHRAALQKQKIKVRKNPYKVDSSTRKQLKKAGFPEKYIKFLERCINTQVSGKKPSVTELIKQGGAGQIQSQFGEVTAMAFMSIRDPAMRRKFADIINSEIVKSAEEFGGGKKASSIATRDWVESSLTHAEAFDSAMDEKYGKGQWRFEGAAWDIRGDIEALGLDYKNKGFSTDVMLRVQPLKDGKPYGPARAQKNSLKKDENIFFFNGSINEVNNFVLNFLDEGERKKVRGFEAIASKAGPSNKNVEERNAAIAEAEKITGLKGTKAIKALKEKALGLRDKALNAAPKEVQDAVSKVRNFGPAQTASAQNLIKTANTTIKNPNNVIDNAKNIDSAEKDFAKFAYKAVQDCQKEGGDLTRCIRQKLAAAGEGTTDDRVCKVAVMACKVGVAAGDPKSKEALEKHYNLAVEAGNRLMEIIPESEQLMGGLMQKLADAFPIKTCMDGEEFMCIDGMKVTQKTLQTVFGLNSYDELRKGMKLRRLPNGEIILVYGAKDKNGRDIPIGVVGTRQKGKGYEGTVGFEISCSDDFALAIAEANTKNGDTSASNEKARQSIGKRVGKRKK